MMDKLLLYQQCLAIVDGKINELKHAIEQARLAATEDTKSSAGDKYETTREMMQQEINRHQAQLLEAGQQKMRLQSFENVKSSTTVQNGSLVKTNRGFYYLAVSLGEINTPEVRVFVISQASPFGKILLGKKINESFSFNNQLFEILACC